MAKNVTVGDECLTPIAAAGYPKSNRNTAGIWEKEEQFYINKKRIDEYIPAAGARNGEFFLLNVEVETVVGFEDIRLVKLKWQTLTLTAGGNRANGIEESFSSNTQRTEKRVEEHPDWGNLTATEQKNLKSIYSTFTLVTVSFQRQTKENKQSFKLSELDILGDVNKIHTPTGLQGATAKKWMNTGKSVNYTADGTLETTEQWQYDLYEWAGVITAESSLRNVLTKLGL